MKSRENNQRGQAVAFYGIFCLMFVGLAALVIDSARLYFVARETQTVADASALGGAMAYVKGDNYVTGAQTEASLNYANGNLFNLDDSAVSKGFWDSSTNPATFTKDGTPTNAVMTIPQLTVNNLVPMWSATSLVKRAAVAAFETLGQANPGLPVVLGDCFTCDPGHCTPDPIILSFGNTGNTSAGWWQVSGSGKKSTEDFIPAGCGGGGTVIGPTSANATINLSNGVTASLCNDFPCLVGNQYLVPVSSQSCGAAFNQSTTIAGFATIKILGTDCNSIITGVDTGGNWTMEVQPHFIDCSHPNICTGGSSDGATCSTNDACPGGVCNATICTGIVLGGSCPRCGTGKVALVQ